MRVFGFDKMSDLPKCQFFKNRIFLPLRFYVKSMLGCWQILNHNNWQFNNWSHPEFLFWISSTLKNWKNSPKLNLESLKLSRVTGLDVFQSPKLISCKIWESENFFDFHAVSWQHWLYRWMPIFTPPVSILMFSWHKLFCWICGHTLVIE